VNTKDKVLLMLVNNAGEIVSGERMANELKISRNAIWKAIQALKNDGHIIESITRQGHVLREDNDILSVPGMLPFLSADVITEKLDIRIYDSLESTSKKAKELAVAGARHGTIVIANTQTEGMGKRGDGFYSPPDTGIYMSVVLHPIEIPYDSSELVTSFIAVAVCEAIEAISNKRPRIRPVNDILIDRKKVCGILTEAGTDFESGKVQWICVGIGIHFSTTDFPEGMRGVGAVFRDGDSAVLRNRLIAEIISKIYGEPYNKARVREEYEKRLIAI
jgi:BirA family biotin operon repressor/biotin-[acetyl-CoA-carboxylase] ligase